MGIDVGGLERTTRGDHGRSWYETPITQSDVRPIPPAPYELEGEQLVEGKYRVVRLLGEGGMGRVMLAQDVALQRRVALKVMRPELLASDSVSQRFLTEARSMARVQHPNVLGVFAYGQHEGLPYLVMEYVPGQTLASLLASRRGQGLRLDEALGLLEPICRGVSAIHAAGMVHRDIKPSNILLGPGPRVVVADLGLARFAELHSAESRWSRSGTPAFMAPEIAMGEDLPAELAAAADVYSVGVIAHQLLTGRLPPDPLTGDRDESVRLRGLGLDPALERTLRRALARSPRARTSTVEALRRGLLEIDAHRAERAGPTRILVVDEDAHYREMVRVVLARAFPRAVVESVEDGPAALRSMSYYPPDLIVIDLETASGPQEVMGAASRHEPYEIPILGMASDSARLGSPWSATAFLRKPFDPSLLVMLARVTLERGRAGHPSSSAADGGGGSLLERR